MKNKNQQNRSYSLFFHNSNMPNRGRFSGISKKIIAFFCIMVFLVVAGGIYPPARDAHAGAINNVTTTLSAAGAGAESQITVTFTPATAITTNDTITVYIGENSGGDPWVDTDATIDATDVTCAQTGATFDTYVQTDASGTTPLLVSCDVASGGDASQVTVTIGDGVGDDLYNPAGADIYTVSVVTNDDSGAGLAYVGDANDVDVSVTVLPNLSMLLDNADGTYCTGTPVVTCNLGTVLTTTTASGNYDINVGTNGTGATVQINEDTDLGTITDYVEDSGAITAGTDEYGINVAADASWTESGIYADDASPIEPPATNLATTASDIDEAGDDITVTHVVAVDSTVAAGTHSHTVTYTATATF